MSARMDAILRRLTHVAGVRGAMIADAAAGIPVVSDLREGVRETDLAALAGSLYGVATAASQTAGFGGVGVLQLQGEDGHLLMAGAGDLLVVALTEPAAQLGLVRIQAARAARELEE